LAIVGGRYDRGLPTRRSRSDPSPFEDSRESRCKPPAQRELGMAPAGAGAGLTKTRPQTNPRDWKKPAREQTRGCIFAPAPADFGRVSGARGSNNRYNKNIQIHQFKQSNNTFL